jgi:Ca2+-binding RTX toxin-like protein
MIVSPSRVDVDLTAGVSQGEGTDTFANIEKLHGSEFDDSFVGDPITAGLLLVAGERGRDFLDLRTASHRQRAYVTIDAPRHPPLWADYIVERINRIHGSRLRDHIRVVTVGPYDPRAHFFGSGGSDTLVGGSHHDVLRGGPGNDTLNGMDGRDNCLGGRGANTLRNCEAFA